MLFLRSEDSYRHKKEQGDYIEFLKEPSECVSEKYLFESMLRNDAI